MVSRPMAAGATVVVAAAAAAFVLWPRSSGLQEGATVTPLPSVSTDAGLAGTGTTGGTGGAGSASNAVQTISVQESTLALCQVRTAAVNSLLGGTTGSGRFEALRDAIPALSERMTEVQSAANGRAQVKPVLTVVQGVYTDWTTALNTYDSGRPNAGATALNRAGTKIKTLDATVKKALPAAKC